MIKLKKYLKVLMIALMIINLCSFLLCGILLTIKINTKEKINLSMDEYYKNRPEYLKKSNKKYNPDELDLKLEIKKLKNASSEIKVFAKNIKWEEVKEINDLFKINENILIEYDKYNQKFYFSNIKMYFIKKINIKFIILSVIFIVIFLLIYLIKNKRDKINKMNIK